MRLLALYTVLLLIPAVAAAGPFKGKRHGVTLYEVIGAAETATDDELLTEFRAAVDEFRPLAKKKEAKRDAFNLVARAWLVLSRPALRKAYDNHLAELRKRGALATDGEYHGEEWESYRQLVFVQNGSEDPAGYDHDAAFRIFHALYEQKHAPRFAAKGLSWADAGAGKCKSQLARIFRIQLFVGLAASLLMLPGDHFASGVPVPGLGLTPAIRPEGYRAPPPAPLPDEDEAAIRAARSVGQGFATDPR